MNFYSAVLACVFVLETLQECRCQTTQYFNLVLSQTISNGVPAPGAGNLEGPGSTDVYTFTAAAGQVVYFQAQSGDSCSTQLYWRCSDPTNGLLFDEPLADSGFCGPHDPGKMTLDNAGTYTLTVYGQGTNFGTYQFTAWGVTNQFFNLPIGQSVSNGVPALGAGDLENPGDEDVYTFRAAAGSTVYFEEQSNDSCGPEIFWRCTDSTGAVLFDELLANHGFCGVHQPGLFTLTHGGAYTITAYGQGAASGTYQFTVWSVTNEFFNLAIGQSVSNGVPASGAGIIETPGEEETYTFEATAGQMVYFEEQSNDSCGPEIFWRCTDPSGAPLFDELLANHGFCGVHQPGLFTLTNGGAYTITVYGQADVTGTYQFEVWPVTNQFFNLAIGQSVSNGVPALSAGNIETPGEEETYTFEATAGQMVYFEEQSNDSCGPQIFWRCTDPAGAVLFDELLANHGFCGVHQPGLFTLTNAGAYNITVYGQADVTGTYQFAVWPVTNQFFNLALGQSVSNGVPALGAGDIETPGVEDIYTFAATAGQTVYFEEQSNDSCGPQIFWRCTDPAGAVLFDELLANHGFCGVHQPGLFTLTNAGAYNITVYGQADVTGTYQFEVWPVTNQIFNISLGQPVGHGIPLAGAGDINTPGVEDIYTFAGSPGQTVYFEERSNDSCGPQIFWRCTDPTGAVLFDELLANQGFCGVHQPGLFTLTNGGDYTIAVYGQADATGTYQFEVWNVTNLFFPIDIGAGVSNNVPAVGAGQILIPGEKEIFSFNAMAGEQVFFNEQTGDSCTSSIYWRCVDPTGALLFDEQIAVTGFCGVHDPGLFVLTNQGAYTITVYGLADATGNFAFKLWRALPAILAQPRGANLPAGDATAFAVLADSFIPVTYQWRFDGVALPGATNATLGLTNLLTTQAGEYDIIVSNSFGAVTSAGAALTIYTNVPNLAVTVVAGPAQAFAGEPVFISWGLTNMGNGIATGPWLDAVLVSRDPSGDNPTYVGSYLFPTNLDAGQSVIRTQAVLFPPSLSGAYYLVVQTDCSNQVAEAYPKTNTTTVALNPIQLLPPDLTVTAVTVTPSAQLGQAVTVQWTVQNIGTAPANASWSDGLFLSRDSNPADGVRLLVTNAPAPLPSGSNYTATTQVVLPLSYGFGAGNYSILVVADLYNTQPESNEGNNVASAPISLTLPPLPDLAASGLLAPTTASPGESITLSWVVTNQGTAGADGIWTESAMLTSDGTLSNAQTVAVFTFTNTLDPGDSLTRTQAVTMPLSTGIGNLYFAVQVNSGGELVEMDTNNNLALATNSTFISAALTVQTPAQMNESDPPATGSVTRNGDLSQPLTAALSNSNPAHVMVPSSVAFGPGAATATFTIQPIPDHVVDGPEPIAISATAPGFSDGMGFFILADSDVPMLTLQVASSAVLEGNPLIATISRPLTDTNDLTVFPRTSNPNHLAAPLSVVIPANSASNTFLLQAIDDGLISTGRTVIVTASASGYVDAPAVDVFVADADVPAVQVTLAASVVSEGAGPQATTATVTRSPVTTQPVILQMVSSNTTAALVPPMVTIPAGQASATFPVAAVNDNIPGNTRQTLISAIILDSTLGVPVADGGSAVLTVLDDNGPALRLALARTLVPPGLNPATTATLSRNADTNQDLLVTLTSSDVNHATVPAAITIPAGQSSAAFGIASTPNGAPGVDYPVAVTASAAGFTPGYASLTVADVNLPDLVVASITAPATNQTEAYATISYRIANQGQAPATGSFLTEVFLTLNPATLTNPPVAQYTFNGSLPSGQFFDETVQTLLPVSAGDYWVVVTTDVGNTVPEALQNNDSLVSTVPIHVGPAYEATVTAEVHSSPAGTPVPLQGRAFRANGDFAAQVPVDIFVWLRGTERVISAQTDTSGNFTTTFIPLPNEAGVYQIGAAHPGDATAPVQDTFTLFGMLAYPSTPTLNVVEQNSATGAIAVANLSEVPLSSLGVTVGSQMANVTGSASFTTNSLPGLATNVLTYVLSASDASVLQGAVTLHLTSAEGAVLDVPLQVSVIPRRDQVVALPGNLLSGMKRGDQAVVEFDLANLGGAPTAPLSILAPNLPWLHVASANPLPSLGAGATNHVTLQLTPAADLAVGDYTGALIVSGGDVNLPVSFDFRALSEAKGDLRVTAIDEYTYYAAGSPPVAGAAVSVNDPVSGLVLTNGITDANGIFFVPQLPEGLYVINVSADQHISFQGTRLVTAGVTNDVQAFISRETVQYLWTVTPTEISDDFNIQIETTFQTFVPIPVVTIEPYIIDLAQINAEITQIPLRISNHGLVAANDFHLVFGGNSDWELTPLISDVGTLAADTSLTVPLTIRRLTPFSNVAAASRPAGRATPKAGSGSCISGAGIWTLFCGTLKTYSTPVAIANAGGCAGGIAGSGGGGTGSPGQPYASGPAFVMPFDCSGTNGNGTNNTNCTQLTLDWSPAANAILQPGVKILETVANAALAANLWTRTLGLTVSLSGTAKGKAQTCCNGQAGLQASGELSAKGTVTIGKTVTIGADKQNIDFPVNGVDGKLSFEGKLEAAAVATPTIEVKGTASAGCGQDPDSQVSVTLSVPIKTALEGKAAAKVTANGVTLLETNAASMSCGLYGGVSFTATYSQKKGLMTCYKSDGLYATDNVKCFGQTFDALDYEGGKHYFIQPSTDCPAALDVFEAGQLTGLLQELLRQAAQSGPPTPVPVPRAGGGICAEVRLELDQDLVLTRSAFNATLKLINADPVNSLSAVSVQINVLDGYGNSANDQFSIQTNQLSGLTATDGTGLVGPGTTGSASWLIVPASGAATAGPTSYSIGGYLTYVQGTNFLTVPFQPVPITVYPDPQLHVKYFNQRDVFGDDPLTPIVEPSIPFSLAVMIHNTGYGAANDVRITSAQPKIIDNEKGLLIDFKIIGTQVAGQNVTPSLTVDFGSINPGGIAIGQWLMISTLQGLFTDYSATLEQTGGPLDKELSIIDEVSIHEMIHLVQAQGTFEDGLPDFLVSEGRIPPFDLPDTLYLSDGSTNPVQVIQVATVAGQLSSANLSVQLVADLPPGWTYLNVPDPGNGQFDLVRVVRSDGVEIYFNTNAWTTDRTFIGEGKPPIYEHKLHLLDYDSTGSYQLFYQMPQPVDSIPPTSSVAALPAASYDEFPITWSGEDTGGSGLAYFDIYVSDDGGPFMPWVTQTTETGDTYFGTLGHTYAFYSSATDNANNHEAPHTTPDAQTTVSLVNHPPTINPIPEQIIHQGDVLRVVATAHDPATNALTFSLLGSAPAGMQIDPFSGVITWVTGGAVTPGTNLITVEVLNNGIPREGVTASFNVIVLPGNTPPVLAPIASQTIFEGDLLIITNTATDSTFPKPTLTFSLGLGAPTNSAINPSTGVFQWEPTHLQIDTTNLISVIVADNGNPPLSATQSFQVIVLRALPDLVVTLGSTNLLRGQGSSVPLTVTAALAVTNVAFELEGLAPNLTAPSLVPLAPELASAVVQPAGSNWQVSLTAASGRSFLGSNQLAQLAFNAGASGPSSIVPLEIVNLTGAWSIGLPVTNVVSVPGRVFEIGREPLLDAWLGPGQTPGLTVYGSPGANYTIQSRAALGGSKAWQTVSGIVLSGTFGWVTNLPPIQAVDFFRAVEAGVLLEHR